MSVLVVDYGMGNLGSVKRAFEEAGATVIVSQSLEALKSASKVILPGVGAYPDGMKALIASGWNVALEEFVVTQGKPILGICLGMQLLASLGHEGEKTDGLGFIPGSVDKFSPPQPEVRVPHVGWNEVNPMSSSHLFDSIDVATDYYFVHSYHFVPENPEHILATTPYCGEFVSAVGKDNVYGVQFHPEKSSKAGFKLINNFLNI